MISIYNKTLQKVNQKNINYFTEYIFNELNIKKDINIIFVSKAYIKSLNSQYRGENKITDILSFSENTDNKMLGELYICLTVAFKNASKKPTYELFNKNISKQINKQENEVYYLILHGILHLLGQKHSKEMFRIQNNLFNKFL
jgi:probable rRNA maturation factor